ncbi:hypothetical protein ACFFRR_009771 [Megaselia abdita]
MMTSRYLASLERHSTAPLRLGGFNFGIFVFLVKRISSVLAGFTPRPHLLAHSLGFHNSPSKVLLIVFGQKPVSNITTSSANVTTLTPEPFRSSKMSLMTRSHRRGDITPH